MLFGAANAQNVTTYAGGGNSGADGTAKANFSFSTPFGLAVDSKGNIYVGDNGINALYMIDTLGKVYARAGSLGNPGFKDGTGTGGAQTSGFLGLAIDGSDNVYFVDNGNNAIRKVSAYTGNKQIASTVHTVAGQQSTGFLNDTGLSAQFNFPQSISFDPTYQNLYIADQQNYVIRKINIATHMVNTVAGVFNGIGGVSADGDTPTASFSEPQAVFVDPSGNIYVSDAADGSSSTGAPTIRKIVITGTKVHVSTITAISLTPSQYPPYSMTMDKSGNLYIAQQNNIIKYNPNTQASSVFAGSQNDDSGHLDGNQYNAGFSNIGQMALSKDGKSIFVADSSNHRIRQVSLTGGAGIKDIVSFKNASIHPNPATNSIIIAGENQTSEVAVFDMSGNEMMRSTVAFNGQDYKLPLTNLTNGAYFITIKAADHLSTGKFIVYN